MTSYWTIFENKDLGFLNVFPLLKNAYMPNDLFESLLYLIIPLEEIICILSSFIFRLFLVISQDKVYE